MKITENCTITNVYCDVENCKDGHVILNKKLDKDYCYQHAKDNHICEFIDDYQLNDKNKIGGLFVEKIKKCIESDTICWNKKNVYEQTYIFKTKKDLPIFIFKICREKNWITYFNEIEYNQNLKKELEEEEYNKLLKRKEIEFNNMLLEEEIKNHKRGKKKWQK